NTRPLWACIWIGTLIHHDAVAQRIRGDHTQSTVFFSLSCPLIVGKKEKPVLDDRPAHSAAENVTDQLERSVSFSCCELCLLDEVIVGAGDCIAVIFVKSAVETVGAALCDQRDLGARRTSCVSVVVACRDAELLH